MTKLQELSELGQSIWYDYIRRSFITSGELRALIDQGLSGVTSNPSIFEKAIAGSADYDKDLKRLAEDNKSTAQIYEALVIKDIGTAADILRPVYEKTEGKDGFVSLEVSPELAYDRKKTITEAKRLFETLHRPNIMIKVPATAAGIPAIVALISSGVNVNVTLIFDISIYKDVAEAYLNGLEQLAEDGPSVKGGLEVDRVGSVASFFVSRVDTAVDSELDRIGNNELKGKIGIANGKAAYLEFEKIFSGKRWENLSAKGARAQRPLWASTATKNPLYSDTLYIDGLIGPQTVNTVPPSTLNAFLDHGAIASTLTRDGEDAMSQLEQLAELGVDLAAITKTLQKQGVEAFAKSYDSLIQSISEKRERILSNDQTHEIQFGDLQSQFDQSLVEIRDAKLMNRIWAHDHTVWKEEPKGIINRVGWLHSPDVMVHAVSEITAFVDEVRDAGYTQALLLGMGGSSLAPEMYRLIFGVRDGYLDLAVLDSTDPGAVLEHEKRIDLSKTLFIVSTKSGGTVETLSFMKYFYNRVSDALGAEHTGEHFTAITDPGSSLAATAEELKFRKAFLNDPNIGGRYSALSFFGLVPAGLIGMDLKTLLNRASIVACNSEGCNCPVAGDNVSAKLGTALGVMARNGRDKVTLIISPAVSAFSGWAEQLIAESTGKEGTGILPVEGEVVGSPEEYGRDRFFVYLRLGKDSTYDAKVKDLEEAGHPVFELNLRDHYDIGGELFRWEMATVLSGSMLKINPFDQPNVESAKVLARQMVAAYTDEGKLPEMTPSIQSDGLSVYADFECESLQEALVKFISQAEPGRDESEGRSYFGIHAYVKPSRDAYKALQDLRTKLQIKTRMATTLGYGPRFLHSTGQLHKGDGGNGLFIQITADMPEDIPIPDEATGKGSSISFGVLKTAQALGDRQALLDAGRRVIRFHLGMDVTAGLEQLREALI